MCEVLVMVYTCTVHVITIHCIYIVCVHVLVIGISWNVVYLALMTCLLHLYSQESATAIDCEELDAPSDSSAVIVQKPWQKSLHVGDHAQERKCKAPHIIFVPCCH